MTALLRAGEQRRLQERIHLANIVALAVNDPGQLESVLRPADGSGPDVGHDDDVPHAFETDEWWSE